MLSRPLYRRPLELLLEGFPEGFQRDLVDRPGITVFIAQLQHYLDQPADPDVRGLSEKLKDAARTDQIPAAAALKERVTKKLLEFQFSENAQFLFALVLAEIFVNFDKIVRPAIKANRSQAEIDSLVLKEVIDPVLEKLEDNVLNIYKDEILGFVYFLTGNCHIRWD